MPSTKPTVQTRRLENGSTEIVVSTDGSEWIIEVRDREKVSLRRAAFSQGRPPCASWACCLRPPVDATSFDPDY